MAEDNGALLAEFWRPFENGVTIVLATAAGDDVTARTVSAVRVGDEACFATFDNSVKYAQISGNPRVALCTGATVLRATARVTGGITLPENARAREALRAAFPDEVAQVEAMPGVVIVMVTPITGGFGRMETGEAFSVDFPSGVVTRAAGL